MALLKYCKGKLQDNHYEKYSIHSTEVHIKDTPRKATLRREWQSTMQEDQNAHQLNAAGISNTWDSLRVQLGHRATQHMATGSRRHDTFQSYIDIDIMLYIENKRLGAKAS